MRRSMTTELDLCGARRLVHRVVAVEVLEGFGVGVGQLTSTPLEVLAWPAFPIPARRRIMMRISTTLPLTQTGVPDIAMARHLEDLGYDAVGMADFIVGDGTPSFDATLVLAGAATVTEKIGLEFGVL